MIASDPIRSLHHLLQVGGRPHMDARLRGHDTGEPMKLVRFGPRGREKPGILDAKGRIHDLSKVVPDIAGETLSPKGLAAIRKTALDKLPLVRGNPRLGACVGK